MQLASLLGCVLTSLTFYFDKRVFLWCAGVIFELCLLGSTSIIADALLRMRREQAKSEFSLSRIHSFLLVTVYLCSDLAAAMCFVFDTQFRKPTMFFYGLAMMLVCYFLSNLGLLVIMH